MKADLHARPARHDRVWLGPTWGQQASSIPSEEARAALVDWFARGRPAVVCRGDAGERTGNAANVTLSVTLPAARWLAAIQFTVGRASIVRRAPPLPLAEAIPGAFPDWRAPLTDLDRLATSVGVPLSVVGALAWQHLTGEPYLTPRTAVELVFRPRTRPQLDGILAILRAREDRDDPALGGEAILGWDDAVAWRDLVRGRRRVMVRRAGDEVVMDVDRLLAGLR